MKKTINIAKDFSRYPYGRLREYSKTSGQVFREDLLLPALKTYKQVEVILDGAEGYGSSFLEEAFAGLIRYEKLDKEQLIKNLIIISKEDPSLIDEIRRYIEAA